MFAPAKTVTPGPNLPLITCNEDWARLLQTHSQRGFATIANQHGNNTCPPVTNSSAAALITLYLIQHYAYDNWHGNMDVHDCLAGIFRLLRIDPSISLVQQQEIDQMFYMGEAPHLWTRQRHFLSRDSYGDPLGIPTCCGPWHNGSNHFVTFYMYQEYWTILGPLHPARASYPTFETQLHNAINESFAARGLHPLTLPPYKRVERIAVQNDSPLPPWSCGTFAISTTLHLLLRDKHPHVKPRPNCITHSHMLALHKALLKLLLTGTPHPYGKADVRWTKAAIHTPLTRGYATHIASRPP